MQFDLIGRRVVVTAGAAGIGRAIVETFMEQGAHVALCDVDPDALESMRTSNPEAFGTICDVSDPAAVQKFVTEAATALGGIDVLVNNAGISGPTGAAQDLELDAWKRTIDVNLCAMFDVTRHAIPHLTRSEHGRIVNLSSAAGRFGLPQRTPYSASKWGVVGFTKTLSMELGPSRITVNAVLPGPVDGPRLRAIIGSKAQLRGIDPTEVEHEVLACLSIKRLIPPSEIAALVAFLASPAGSSISGQAISIDGDLQSMV